MADLFYPQLKTGAIAHYPIRKAVFTRTVANVLPGGSALVYPDDAARRTTWSWDYVGLTLQELAAIQEFFAVCNGPLRPFTFLDPTGNLLSASSTYKAPAWQTSSAINISRDSTHPTEHTAAVTVVNEGQALQEIVQTLPIPGDYMYSFSTYVSSPTPQSVAIFRRAGASEETVSFNVGPGWTRIWSSGNLQDQSVGLSVGVKLLPGQSLSISAAQLQAQHRLSSYRDRPQAGDVYRNAHWAVEELSVRHLGPNNCSISVAIET